MIMYVLPIPDADFYFETPVSVHFTVTHFSSVKSSVYACIVGSLFYKCSLVSRDLVFVFMAVFL